MKKIIFLVLATTAMSLAECQVIIVCDDLGDCSTVTVCDDGS